jgi:integron integrase
LRHAIRVRHYSIRTEEAYVDWARRFIRFHGRRHPRELGAPEVAAFLTHLAVDRTVAPSTQNQARSALMFLYRDVLQLELPWLQEVVAAKTQRRLPVVLTPSEVRALLGELSGTMGLVAALLYGTGMRLLEALRLRVKDIGFEQRELVVRDGKGGKDRVTVLPENLIAPLQQQLGQARALHQQDLTEGFGEVWLPDALAAKHPAMPRAWGWQWVFPSAVRSADPLGHADVSTTMIYTHVLNRGGRGVRSPLDQM